MNDIPSPTEELCQLQEESSLKDTKIQQLQTENKNLEDQIASQTKMLTTLNLKNKEVEGLLPEIIGRKHMLEKKIKDCFNKNNADHPNPPPKPQVAQRPRGHSNPRRSRGKFRGGRATVPYSSDDRSAPCLASSASFYPAQFSGAGFDGVDLASSSMNRPPNSSDNNFPSYSHNGNIGGQLYPPQPAIGGPSYISFVPNKFNTNRGGYPFLR